MPSLLLCLESLDHGGVSPQHFFSSRASQVTSHANAAPPMAPAPHEVSYSSGTCKKVGAVWGLSDTFLLVEMACKCL